MEPGSVRVPRHRPGVRRGRPRGRERVLAAGATETLRVGADVAHAGGRRGVCPPSQRTQSRQERPSRCLQRRGQCLCATLGVIESGGGGGAGR